MVEAASSASGATKVVLKGEKLSYFFLIHLDMVVRETQTCGSGRANCCVLGRACLYHYQQTNAFRLLAGKYPEILTVFALKHAHLPRIMNIRTTFPGKPLSIWDISSFDASRT